MDFDEQFATNHEESFVRAFIEPFKRERYLEFLRKPKRRDEVLRRFYHTLDFVPSRMAPISNHDNVPKVVEALLRQKGAGETCYVIAPSDELDQQFMPIREALKRFIGEDLVGVVSCLPGKLAYCKAERDQYLLEN